MCHCLKSGVNFTLEQTNHSRIDVVEEQALKEPDIARVGVIQSKSVFKPIEEFASSTVEIPTSFDLQPLNTCVMGGASRQCKVI